MFNQSTSELIMSEQAIASKTRFAIWLGVAITLVPLVPYALKGAGA
jgi:hypothetical protein